MAKETIKDAKVPKAAEKETIKDAKIPETAENKPEIKQEQEKKTVKEPVYSADELAAGAKNLFGTMPECVLAALRAAGKSECTVGEAKEILEKFLKRVVQ